MACVYTKQFAEPEIKTRSFGQKAINFENARTRKSSGENVYRVEIKSDKGLSESDLKKCFSIAESAPKGLKPYGNPREAFPQIVFWTKESFDAMDSREKHTKEDEKICYLVVSKEDASEVRSILQDAFKSYTVSVHKI